MYAFLSKSLEGTTTVGRAFVVAGCMLTSTLGIFDGKLAGTTEAKAAGLDINILGTDLNSPYVSIYHRVGSTEGWDFGKDADFLGVPSPTIDFFSRTTIPGHTQLSRDSRPSTSMTTVYTEITGKGIESFVSGYMHFTINSTDGSFDSKDIFFNLYNPERTELAVYNVKDLADSGISVAVNIRNGLSYYADVAFAPVGTPQNLGTMTLDTLWVDWDVDIAADSLVCDNLTVGATSVACVPEPASATLLIIAVAGAFGVRVCYSSRLFHVSRSRKLPATLASIR
jgi:hypothetical protein